MKKIPDKGSCLMTKSVVPRIALQGSSLPTLTHKLCETYDRHWVTGRRPLVEGNKTAAYTQRKG